MTQPPSPPEAPPRTGRRSVGDLFHTRPTRGQVVAAALLAVLGVAATVQVRDNGTQEDLTGARQADLIALINSLSLATDRANTEIDQLTATRNQLQGTARDSGAALADARQQLQVWQILAGTVPVVGSGVRVTVSDAAQVGTDQVINGLQELRNAGAEAIELNDRVRVVAQTAIAEGDGQGILVDGVPLEPPYLIEAIGDPGTLSTALDFYGGFVTGVEEVGGRVRVQEQGEVQIASVREPPRLLYAEPVEQE